MTSKKKHYWENKNLFQDKMRLLIPSVYTLTPPFACLFLSLILPASFSIKGTSNITAPFIVTLNSLFWDAMALMWYYCSEWHDVHNESQTLEMLMMTSSSGNIFRVTGPLWGASPVTGGFPSQRPVTRSFDVFFDIGLNKLSSKQSRCG